VPPFVEQAGRLTEVDITGWFSVILAARGWMGRLLATSEDESCLI
jgi:hypothetical protein